ASATYTATVLNLGPMTATSVGLTVTRSAGVLTFRAPSQGTCSPGGTCSFGTLAPASSSTPAPAASVVFDELEIPNAESVDTEVTVGASEADPDPTNNLASIGTSIVDCDVFDDSPCLVSVLAGTL